MMQPVWTGVKAEGRSERWLAGSGHPPLLNAGGDGDLQ